MSDHLIIQTTHSVQQTEACGAALAHRWIRELRQHPQKNDCIIVAMCGDLGVGKTAFVRGAVSVLAPQARVTSPTYTIVNEYPMEENGTLFHFDMYRIEQPDDLDSIGFWDYLSQRGIAVIEWSEHVMPYLPKPDYMVNIKKKLDNDTFANENEREITVTIAGDQS